MVNPSAQSVSRLSLGSILFLLIACAGPQEVRLEKMGSTPASLPCKLESLTGTRDGEQMKARLVLASDSSRIALEIVLRIGVPTVLESGRYQWQRPTGTVEGPLAASSVTFLGGQSDGVSIGGLFSLVGPDGVATHQVRLPTTLVGRAAPRR
jgi:hypothetical protein